MDDNYDNLALRDQVSALLESTNLLQRRLAQVLPLLAHTPGHTFTVHPAPSASQVHFDLQTPASAQASIIAPGVPIPSRGWQKDHSPKGKVIANTKERLMQDNWPDCDDTDEHAKRLSEAMLRMGMEDMDNFATEASRLNCSNMAISATLVSAVVATFVSETYSNYETLHMQVVNGLWLLSLFLSLATATLCVRTCATRNFPHPHADTLSLPIDPTTRMQMLVSEWLTWSTSQELRDLSLLYRLIRTAFRSLLMHMSIFLFFAGLMVLMWNENTWAVCLVPSIAVVIFVVYYVAATVRSPFMALFHSVRQFGEDDFRGLRVQIWTPFTLGTHHTVDTIIKYGIRPVEAAVRKMSAGSISKEEAEAHASDRPRRPSLRVDASDFGSAQKTITPTYPPAIPYTSPETSHPIDNHAHNPHPPTLAPSGNQPPRRFLDRPGVESPHSISRAGTPVSEGDAEAEHQRKLRATRLRRLTEHEIMRPRNSRLPE